MKNKEIAKIFYEIASYLEMEGVKFKPYAYEKAAITLETLERDIREIYQEGGKEALKRIPGVGESIAEKIEEYLKKGRIEYYENLRKKIPVEMEELTRIEGMGPKRVKVLYQKLGIRTLKDLEKAAKAGKIASLFGFGEKSQKNILEGIVFFKSSRGRFLLGEILPAARQIEAKLRTLKEIDQISITGSVRRAKETIGDLDFLATLRKTEKTKIAVQKVMDFFVSLPEVVKIWGKGTTRSSVRMKQGFNMDLRLVPAECYGAALQYFTGSKEHNIETRKIAINRGLKLNEYGVFQGKKRIAGKTEQEVYQVLGMDWIPPEMRENQGEIELALAHRLPEIIDYRDLKGDLHCHSNWDGGANSILEMAEAAIEMGYQYLGISDHTKFLKIEKGLDERKLAQQRKEIDRINHRFQVSGFKFQLLQGAETNILKNGLIDIKDEALRKLDYAIAGIHSNFKMVRKEMTERIIRAMKNPYIKIISHPTGRILKKRDEYQVDFEKILRAAKEFGVALEINSFPERLDLNDKNIRLAKEAGVKMVINTDSHHKDQLRYIEFGIAQARRGWAEKKDIINSQPLKKLLKLFKK